jgi:Cleft lip and palate transmembrane protein 1 (CLPTM1)
MWCQSVKSSCFVSSHGFRFEILAFKSDVSHWRKKDELTGVSIRYVSSPTEVILGF